MPRKPKPALEHLVPELQPDLTAPQPGPAHAKAGAKKGAEYVGITQKLAQERLRRLRHQNRALVLTIAEKKGEVVSADELKRLVLSANASVKQQILAIPFRISESLASITEPREIARVLHQALTAALNDLAYEREHDGTA
jgi:hypothetical protein